jgi:hypothetical protein
MWQAPRKKPHEAILILRSRSRSRSDGKSAPRARFNFR